MAELPDAIAVAAGTTSLSDLHHDAAIRSRIPRALRHIPPGAHSLKAWQDAARYIIRDDFPDPATEREARKLLEKLS